LKQVLKIVYLLFLILTLNKSVHAQIDTVRIKGELYPVKYSSLDSVKYNTLKAYFLCDTSHVAVIKSYRRGRLNGKSFFYFPNGDLRMVINYKNGLKDGKWRQYQSNQLEREGRYKKGKRQGIWKGYFDGHVFERVTYRKGIRIRFEGYCPKFRT
jgi:hypothetical protein